jgi:hypothetical protein
VRIVKLGLFLAAVAALSLPGVAFGAENVAPSLDLTPLTGFDGAAPQKHSRWADDVPAAPASMESALGSLVFASLSAEAAAFSKDVEMRATAGGGDGDRGGYILVEALAFILGVIPGFGIGHLVGGSIFGFVTWLCVDIVIGVLLFWVFPILLFPLFQYMYTISVIAVVVERIFEGYSAFRAAYWNYGPGHFDGPRYGDDRSGPVDMSPNLVSLHF